MSGWTTHEGLAVGLPLEGVDTDQLIPARFMSTPRAQGYGGFLLHDIRRDAGGALRGDFPLNDSRADGASILVARRNFGGGSSREAAAYALLDAGYRAVVAPSFGDIFQGNAVNNGLLPARVTEAEAEALLAALAAGPVPGAVDIGRGTLCVGEVSVPFTLAPGAAEKLVNGWDDIDLTRHHQDRIGAFRDALKRDRPWLWPGASAWRAGA